jgi:hypothetical protein
MTMKNLLKLSTALLFGAALLSAQTVTPSTTLSAAQSATATTVCLTATTGVQNQTGVYVDQEYELVQISNNTTVAAGPTCVPVSRNNRNAGSGPTAHLSGALAWIAYTPANSLVPGANGFSTSSTLNDVGPCTRSAQLYLPKIFVNRGMKRDCASITNNTTSAQWVDFAPAAGADFPSPMPLQGITANGALSVSSGNYVLITKAGVIALTLAAPTAGVDDGMVISITSANGAYADTLTATSLLQNGATASPYTTATFGVTSAYIGGTIVLKAYNGFWFVVSAVGVALT